jgi:hypothetical protein
MHTYPSSAIRWPLLSQLVVSDVVCRELCVMGLSALPVIALGPVRGGPFDTVTCILGFRSKWSTDMAIMVRFKQVSRIGQTTKR